MDSLNHDNQADVIEAFNSTSMYLDDPLNIDNPHCEGMSFKFVHLDYKIKPTPQIPKPHFWIFIFLLQMDLFLLKFMINAMTLILIYM